MPQPELSKEEILKSVAENIKEEMARREKREIFDRVLCAVISAGVEAPDAIFGTTKRIIERRQQMIEKGEI